MTVRRAVVATTVVFVVGCGGGVASAGPGTSNADVSGTDTEAGGGESSTTSGTGGTGGSDGGAPKAVCGDGAVDGTEQCDDGNQERNDGCTPACKLESCGDGLVQAEEQCDLGTANANDAYCTSACRLNVCGDGLRGPLEGCDDGNEVANDGCSAECILETCGNGHVEDGEVCDDGNLEDDDSCTTLCFPPTCGDGLVSPVFGEDCDDGDIDNTDSCPNDCTKAVCGDSEIEAGEECDDGGATGDGVSLCSPGCTANVCGDGYRVPAVEACDDGPSTGDGTSGCTPGCTVNICGDGYAHSPSEQCDEGELNGYAPCTTSCASAPEISEIEIAPDSACVRYEDGVVRCFGGHSDGQLGYPALSDVGDNYGEMPPPAVNLGGSAIDIAGERGSGSRFCAARSDGAVVCWGSGRGPGYFAPGEIPYSGIHGPMQEPDGGWSEALYNVADADGEMPPEPVPLGPGNALRVDVAGNSACALFDDGGLRCWGETTPQVGTLGYGTATHLWAPQHFPPPNVNLGAEVVDFVHARNRTCTLTVDSTVRCFGIGASGLLGLGGTAPQAEGDTLQPPEPTDVGPPVIQIAGGNYTTCVLGTDGGVRCFGSNAGWLGYAQPGEDIGDELGEMPPATLELGPDPIVQVVVSQYQACALSDQGEVRCWGGQWRTYGYESFHDPIGHLPGEMPPAPLDLGGSAATLFAGSFQTFCALMTDRSLVCWGSTVFGSPGTSGGVGDQPGEMPPPRIRLYD